MGLELVAGWGALRLGLGPWLPLFPLVVLGVLLLTWRSYFFGAALLIFASYLDRPEFPVGSAHVRLPELAALGLAGAVVLRIAIPSKSPLAVWNYVRRVPLFWPVSAFLTSNATSVAFSPERGRSVGLNLIFLTLALGYLGLAGLVFRPGQARRLLVIFTVAAVAEALLGLTLLLAASRSPVFRFGVQPDPETGFIDAIGTLADANFFGSFLVPSFLVVSAALVLLAGRRAVWLRIMFLTALLVLGLGILASLTRGAWLGLIVAVASFAAIMVVRRLLPHRKDALMALLAVTTVIVFSAVIVGVSNLGHVDQVVTRVPSVPSPATAPSAESGIPSETPRALGPPTPVSRTGIPVWSRIASAFDFTRGSTQGRLYIARLALREWRDSPWFGTGTGSYHSGRVSSEHPWILNMFVMALHDTGVVGLLILVWLVVAYFVHLFRSVLRSPDAAQRLTIAGLLAGALGLFVAFQASSGLILLFPWMLMGLSVVVARAFRRESIEDQGHRAESTATASEAFQAQPGLVKSEIRL